MRTEAELRELLAVVESIRITDDVRKVTHTLMQPGAGDLAWELIPPAQRPLTLRCMCDLGSAGGVGAALRWILGANNLLLEHTRELAQLTNGRQHVLDVAGRALGVFGPDDQRLLDAHELLLRAGIHLGELHRVLVEAEKLLALDNVSRADLAGLRRAVEGAKEPASAPPVTNDE